VLFKLDENVTLQPGVNNLADKAPPPVVGTDCQVGPRNSKCLSRRLRHDDTTPWAGTCLYTCRGVRKHGSMPGPLDAVHRLAV